MYTERNFNCIKEDYDIWVGKERDIGYGMLELVNFIERNPTRDSVCMHRLNDGDGSPRHLTATDRHHVLL